MTPPEPAASAEPEMNVGVLVMASPNGDVSGLRAFGERMTTDVRGELADASGIPWRFDAVEPARLADDEPRRPSDFLDEASLRMVEGPFDAMLVVTDAPLMSRRHAIVSGLASRVSHVIVVSPRKLLVGLRGEPQRKLESEPVRWNAAALLLHLVGHMLGVPPSRAAGDAMAPFRMHPGRRAVPRFGPRSRERLRKAAPGAPEREWHDPDGPRALAAHVAAGARELPLVARALWRNRAPFLALTLPSLATAAVVPTLILVFTAEIWDVGLNMPNHVAAGFAVASVMAATWYLTHVQNLFFPRKEKRVLTEHMALVNVTIFFTILLAVVGLFVMVTLLMLMIEVWVFPAGLIATWPTLEDPVVDAVDKVRLAIFISTVSVLTGALGGGLESRTVVRHLALFEDTP